MLPRMICHFTFLLVSIASAAESAEWWVDGGAAPGGDGSAAKPMQTIAEAVKASQGGDTITIRQGTYRETVALDRTATAEQPTVLRAAPGHRVILSGFTPVAGWQPFREGMYVTTLEGPVEDLFVGYTPQPVSRWPDVNEPWRYLTDCDAVAGTVRDCRGFEREPWMAEIATRPAAARLYLYVARGNYFNDAPLSRLDLPSSTLTLGEKQVLSALQGERDRYQIVNHVALVRRPGQWAAEPLDENRTRLVFWPADQRDLQHTRIRQGTRSLIRVGHWKDAVAHVRVEGLEVTGSGRTGIEIGRADHVTVTRCIAHHNRGNGISARRTSNVTVSENIVFANASGISIASSREATVERNEIALNMVDGLIVAGNVSGKPDGEPITEDVAVRRNYIHHHLLLGHPDNMQTYRGVERLVIEDNVFLWGGQGLMTEETNHSVLRNCVVVGTGAVAVIFGHANAGDWTIEGSTIGLGGWGALSLTGKNYQVHHNILFHNPVSLGETVTSDHNLYLTADDSQPIALASKPKWRKFLTPEEAAAATGQEEHSLRANSRFRGAPARQAVALWHDENTPGRLFVRGNKTAVPTEGFAVGDQIEINGDGVLRRVTAVDGQSLRFEPALPQLPLRGGLIWNWASASTPILDLRLEAGNPALASAGEDHPIGATLDIPAFQRGDFDGDGRRDLPNLPDDLKASWPNPNAIVLPLHGG